MMVEAEESDGLTTADLLEFYKALSDPTRLRIAGLLGQAPAATSELARSLGLPAPTVARHLSRLVAVALRNGWIRAGTAWTKRVCAAARRAHSTLRERGSLEEPRTNAARCWHRSSVEA